jgi:hypothetical protein
LANGFSTFRSNHGIITGLIFTTVGLAGVVGSITGELANMIAALFVPDILFTEGSKQADKGGSSAASTLSTANSIADQLLKGNPITGPIEWAKSLL